MAIEFPELRLPAQTLPAPPPLVDLSGTSTVSPSAARRAPNPSSIPAQGAIPTTPQPPPDIHTPHRFRTDPWTIANPSTAATTPVGRKRGLVDPFTAQPSAPTRPRQEPPVPPVPSPSPAPAMAHAAVAHPPPIMAPSPTPAAPLPSVPVPIPTALLGHADPTRPPTLHLAAAPL